ncbi:flagellar biosynthetic protein FliR [Tepidanaerobacter syntrophicus]|uniref:Flagellar biosynthetic protein FliR n=1 Tax=Tepidanaerobacter syntrophicus TaxID=224999 RepID=A0A0U9HH82_9FIRM|nr:flagellar biosynthetic protein FliR [Tepidanaerobacter syntrophicus]GAQ26240.1 flagellar biosynthetic protein FliR [Tepidanaerobacter syntrophicus]HHV83546.1 flagellar type III secretion system protein FliR [Tepidanaerobacter syntrophicus]
MSTENEIAIIKYLLILFRCSSFFMLTPVFGRREIPAQAKIGLAALISFIVYPFISAPNLAMNFWDIASCVLKEFATGISMGYAVFLVFSALYLAGGIIDFEMGFGMVNVLDPQSNTQIPLMGNYYYILALLMFLTFDGHHMLITAVIRSYELIPLGTATYSKGLLNIMITGFGDMFALGVKIALPIAAIVFLTDLSLGIIARTVPQMNVFILGLPLKIAIGMIGMIIIFPMFIVVLGSMYDEVYRKILMVVMEMQVRP